MELRWVYITVGRPEEARVIGKTLVESRLSACVNLIDNMHSIYFWKGKLQEDTETVLIAKTTRDRVRPLIEKVKAMHSYECPCILSFAIEDGYPPFLKWIEEQVR